MRQERSVAVNRRQMPTNTSTKHQHNTTTPQQYRLNELSGDV
jgi:hypothetical protein